MDLCWIRFRDSSLDRTTFLSDSMRTYPTGCFSCFRSIAVLLFLVCYLICFQSANALTLSFACFSSIMLYLFLDYLFYSLRRLIRML